MVSFAAIDDNVPIVAVDNVEEFRAFKTKYRAYLVKRRIEEMMRMMETLALDDEMEKFVAGRIAYGGEFKPEFIAHEIEMKEEVLDFANYADMKEFVEFRFDADGFNQFVSQYMND